MRLQESLDHRNSPVMCHADLITYELHSFCHLVVCCLCIVLCVSPPAEQTGECRVTAQNRLIRSYRGLQS